ncbi:MAG: hypothetical protein AVO35_06640 [Candidatus Aegiribacteria sp. MLS_C]|nr:MAG: hypothetical protein AVO35_06640 [Candidatus Aegiribacteria sp. MLS_C]
MLLEYLPEDAGSVPAPAGDTSTGTVILRGSGCRVVFSSADDGDDVIIERDDGTRHRVDLPSRLPYRHLSDISPSGYLLVVVSRTRARAVELPSGRTRIILEGPWMTGTACLAEGFVAVLTREGRFTLDMRDPDVAALSSLRGVDPSSGTVTFGCSAMIHLLDANGPGRLVHSFECRADHISSVLEGRVAVLRRSPPDADSWGTLFLGFAEGLFSVLGKHPEDLGRILEAGGLVRGEKGVGVRGLRKALETMEPFRIRKIVEGMGPDPAADPPPVEIVSRKGRIRLALTRGEESAVPLPEGAREALGLGVDDWIADSSPTGTFPVMRYLDGMYRVSLACTVDGGVAEIRPDRELSCHTMCYGFSPDGNRVLLSMYGGSYLVDTRTGVVEVAAPQFREPLAAEILDDDSFAVLSRLEADCSQLDIWMRREDCFRPVSSLSAGLLDMLFHLHGTGLIMLTFRHMPPEDSVTVVLRIDPERGSVPVDLLDLRTGEAWSNGGRCFLTGADGSRYEMFLLGEGEERPPLSLSFIRRQEERPSSVMVFRSGEDGHRYGYIDCEGRWVMEPRFLEAAGFAGGLAAAAMPPHGFRGLVDASGRTVMPFHSSWVGEPAEGYRRVAMGGYPSSGEPADSLFGVFGPVEGWVLEPVYPAAGEFRQGRIRVRYMDGDENWARADGTRLTGESYSECGDFSEGLARFRKGGRCGFADLEGRMVIPPRFEEAMDFSCGLAGVRLQGPLWRCVDTGGSVVVTRGYDEFFPHSEGVACVRTGNCWGYVDTRGEEPFGMCFQRTFNFAGGMGVAVMEGRWHFLTVSGVITPGWDAAYAPFEGIGVYRQDGLFGYADRSGEVVTGPVYTAARNFNQGLAAVMSGGRWGYIDRHGQWAVEPRFSGAGDFSEGLAPVTETAGGPWGYIDREGQMRIHPYFSEAGSFGGGLAAAAASLKGDDR